MKKENSLKRLKMLFEATELTQKQLANKTGITPVYLNGILAGRYNLTSQMFQRLEYHLKN